MLNKLEFNNLVITNKKIIQQARAQTIAKLVQKLRKLKDALEKKPENDKHKDRLRKNVECMAQLKALKRVEIMRSLLLLDSKKLNTVLTNGRATPDEIAVAMLGLNKKMQELLAKFRETLKLSDEANAKWREEILETSKRRLKLDRTEDKRRKRKEIKEQKALTRNRMEWLKEHKPASECITAEPETEEEVIKPEPLKKTEKIKDESSKLKRSKPEKLERQQKVNDGSKKPKTELQQGPTKEKPKVKAQQNESKEVEHKKKERPIQRKPNVEPKEEKQWQKEPNKKLEKHQEVKKQKPAHIVEPNKQPEKHQEVKKQRPTHVVDPFFITESGQPYLSTAVVHSDDSHNESDEHDHHHVKQRSRKPITQRQEYNDTRPSNDRHPSWMAKQQANQRQEYNDTRPSNDRHPSWVAKQQHKPIIANFKGTKTKFSEDGSTAAITKAAPPPSPPTVATTGDDSAAGMHPSWIAKQRLKPKIAAFAGTKIKFDDE